MRGVRDRSRPSDEGRAGNSEHPGRAHPGDMRMSEGAGQALGWIGARAAYPGRVTNPRCLIRKNASFGTDLVPCAG
ncbi:MAG: hypothetical protein JWR10_411, partial [Rubritepida sp.]|nr:hypothetical protein [Rubritepida sp.]